MRILYILIIFNILFANEKSVYIPICYDECIKECKIKDIDKCHEFCLNCVLKSKI